MNGLTNAEIAQLFEPKQVRARATLKKFIYVKTDEALTKKSSEPKQSLASRVRSAQLAEVAKAARAATQTVVATSYLTGKSK